MDAGNAGPFTLEGTRCHLVGRRQVAVIDPGPALDEHVDAVAAAVAHADRVVLLLTHGHTDHAGAAVELAARLGAPVLGAWEEGTAESGATPGPPPQLGFRALLSGERITTDAGDLVAVHTPGHAREHLTFHWQDEAVAFVGDLLLGRGDTTWVGAYSGCVSDYLASLARVEALGTRLLFPTHGPPITDPTESIERYRAHRLARIAQVEQTLHAWPNATFEELLRIVYGGTVPSERMSAARASLSALVEYVLEGGA